MLKAYHEVAKIWEAQLADIEAATRSIFLEQYILESLGEGEIGRRYVDALIRKAESGVVVRCILDAQGTFELFKNLELAGRLEKAGCAIFYYKTLGIAQAINPARLFLRDHRKLLIIDDELTWIGGAVIGERFRTWKDLMVRFDSPEVANIASREFRNQLLRLQDKLSLLAPLETIDAEYYLVGNAPGIGNRFCYEEICLAIMRAQKSVVLVTPYFAPPYKLERILRRRLKNGLSITLITPAVSDHALANTVRERYLNSLIKRGLKVMYVPGMLHAKIVLTDDKWVSFGSMNLDALSLIFNHELNIVSINDKLIVEVKKAISAYLENAKPVGIDDCKYKDFGIYKRCQANWLRYFV